MLFSGRVVQPPNSSVLEIFLFSWKKVELPDLIHPQCLYGCMFRGEANLQFGSRCFHANPLLPEKGFSLSAPLPLGQKWSRVEAGTTPKSEMGNLSGVPNGRKRWTKLLWNRLLFCYPGVRKFTN